MKKTKELTISIDHEMYSVLLRRNSYKRFSVRVNYQISILVNCPQSISNEDALKYLLMHQDWIKKTIEKIKNMKSNYKMVDLESKNKYLWFGKYYDVVRDDSILDYFVFHDQYLLVKTKLEDAKFELENLGKLKVLEMYDELLGKIIKNPIKMKKPSFKKMKTRWGSCNYKTKHVNLNEVLFHLPIDLIKYVIIHEISHLFYPNHGKDFHLFLESLISNHRQHAKAIKNYQFLLFI